MLGYIEYLNVPAKIAVAIIAMFFVMQLIGEVLEFKGKAVPEFLKIRKFFSRRRKEKKEASNTLKEVQRLLGEVNNQYNGMKTALDANTKLTEEMFVQSSRDRIIDFSYKAADYGIHVSREEYHRIFKVYDKYEKFLEEHDMTNGEIDIVYGVVKESYEERMKNHLFTEDFRMFGGEAN